MTDPENPSPWGRRPEGHQPSGRKPEPPRTSGGGSRFSVFLIGVIVFLVILLIAAWVMPLDAIGGNQMGGLFYDGLLLAFIGAGLWAHVRSSPGLALRHMATWVIIFGVLALGYSVWTGNGRLGAEFDSAKGFVQENSISFRADRSGHYFVEAEVNGVPVRFMVDTGASDVALTRKDAQRIGLDVDRLNYNWPYKTANGIAYGARIKLNSIALGPIKTRNISGSVVPDGLDYSLLGMSFLNSLSGYKVTDGVLTLYP